MFGRTFSYFITERFRMFGQWESHTAREHRSRDGDARDVAVRGQANWASLMLKTKPSVSSQHDDGRVHSACRDRSSSKCRSRRNLYVDFDSPVYVNLLAKLMRRTAEQGGKDMQAVFTEMLPGVEQSWFT
jgi:hypothetical protein